MSRWYWKPGRDAGSVSDTTFVNCRSRGHRALPSTYPLIQQAQAHVRYNWDGAGACGMIERSTFREQMEL
jgi:hypothetical protein